MSKSELEDALAAQMRVAHCPAFVRDFRFHPKRRWHFDFAFLDHGLAVEVEGGTWVNGRHSRPQGLENDCEKYAEAIIAGWDVLRVTNHMVTDGRALGFIERALAMPERNWQGVSTST